jgi:hypothetical protein
MSLNNITLLDNIDYGTPSGNYDGSSLDFFSDPAEAAGYYRGQGNIQTLLFGLTGFVGRIKIQATLTDNPVVATWFYIDQEVGDGSSVLTSQTPVTVTGNFSWMRVEVTDFTDGTIDFATLSY